MTAPAPSRVVVLVSADAEWRTVLGLFPGADPHPSPLGAWFMADVAVAGRSEPVRFFHGGWGKIAAAASTQYAVDRWAPELLINLGTCGGFAGEIERGTVLLVERTLVYDIVERMGDLEAHIAHYTTALDLSWLAEPYPSAVRRALLVSADRDLAVDEIPALRARYGAVAGDWESGAIAYVAARSGVRCLILRGVSDLVAASGGEAYGALDVFAAAAARVMGELVAALPAWLAVALA